MQQVIAMAASLMEAASHGRHAACFGEYRSIDPQQTRQPVHVVMAGPVPAIHVCVPSMIDSLEVKVLYPA
jgi:hypothetical protein